MALKYSRVSMLVGLLLAAATFSYGQVAGSHIKVIPPSPVNRNFEANDTRVNRPDTANTGAIDNTDHAHTAPVALKRIAENNSHPIRIPASPKKNTESTDSAIIKRDPEQ